MTIGIESSGNVKALNAKSKAKGLFQFLSSTIKLQKKAHPTLPTWSWEPEVQLQYFLAAMPEFMRRATPIYNAAQRRGMASGLMNHPLAKLIVGFRLAYHVWSFVTYDKYASTKKDVDGEMDPLKYAANVFVGNKKALFESAVASNFSRTKFNQKSFLSNVLNDQAIASNNQLIHQSHGTIA